jgi:indolepyruvate ferredoxin oxidoreductase beta subunit
MEPIRLIVVAVGGQGNLLASKMLGEAALMANVPFRMSEIHGMAQRGGVVESALVFGDAQSMLISDAEADVLLGFEPCETLRALKKCNSQTVVISNTTPLPPFTVSMGRGVYPDLNQILNLIRAKTRRLVAFDALALAKTAGSPMALNTVLLGGLIQTGILPLSVIHMKQAIEMHSNASSMDINKKAFDLGFTAAQQVGCGSTIS